MPGRPGWTCQIGSLRFGSELMNITADATLPGALGSFGFDDEGTPAHPVDIVRDGIWVGTLSGRDSAAIAGIERSAGAIRAEGFDRIPMVRMTNVGLLPGDDSLDAMIAATDDGILMDTNRSWSIDDKRLNFQFGCEIGWEIKGGKRGRLLKNPTYRHQPAVLGLARHARRAGRVDVLGHAELRQGPAGPDRPHRASGGPGALPRDPGGREGVSGTSTSEYRLDADAAEQALDLADHIIDLVHTRAAGAEVEVTVRRGREALTRFATSFIHQNVASDVNHLLIRVSLDGRNATTSFDGPADDESLGRTVDGLLEAARVCPPDPDWPGLAPQAPAAVVDHYDEATAAATPDERARLVAGFVEAAGGLETAGFCSTASVQVAFANSIGQRLTGRATVAELDGICRTPTADGSARRASVAVSALDGAEIGARAATKARAASEPTDLEPGRYQVVLEPSLRCGPALVPGEPRLQREGR